MRLTSTLCCLALSLYSCSSSASPFYIGLTGGWGNTTWGQLVPPADKQNGAMSLSTPISVKEGGAIWGVFAGYEIIPLFALEGSYTYYPTAYVHFDEFSIFAFDHDNRTVFSTRTDVFTLGGKFMLEIPKTPLKAFSLVGVAGTHRNDVLTNHWRISPTFAVGFNYNVNKHVMLELGVNYTGGYGESELDPVQDYIPFLYSVFVHLAYRF